MMFLRVLLLVLIVILAAVFTAPPPAPPVPEVKAEPRVQISHGRFENVTMYPPPDAVHQFVLFLSGDGGWDEDMDRMASELASEGALVAGISMPALVAQLEADGGDCVFPDGDLENLSHYLQAYYKVPTYRVPLLVGYSSGATLAYAMLAQAPAKTFAGAISMGYCPDLELKKPLCKGEGIHQMRRADGKGTDLLPSSQLSAPWIVLHGEQDPVCAPEPAKAFVEAVPGAQWVPLANIGHDYSAPPAARERFRAAYQSLADDEATVSTPPVPADLADLPLIEVPATAGSDTRFAVLLSGDGGWAGLDKDVAAALAAKGIPVVGLDSLRYFWTARTPDGLALDLSRLLRHYAAAWGKSSAILIGYSQGADVLPFALNRFPADVQALVGHSVLMGLGQNAAFEFHLSNWIGDSGDEPIAPEATQLQAARTLCIYGLDEDESLCPQLPATSVQAIGMEGGHHFDGGYDELAQLILDRTAAR